MKVYFFLLIIVFSKAVFAQDYSEKFHLADSLVYATKDTIANAKKGYAIYNELYQTVPKKMTFWYLYDMAYAAHKFNNPDKAFYWLGKTLEHYKEQDAHFLIEKYAKSDFKNLVKLPQWQSFQQKVSQKVNSYISEIKENQKTLSLKGIGGINLQESKGGKTLYQKIQAFNDYPEIPSEVFGFIQLNDSVENNFFARIPSDYNPQVPSKVLFFLNGAVRHQQIPSYPNAGLEEGWQRFYKKYAEEFNVIMVYPNSNKQYNWMLGNEGFVIVPKVLRELKKFVNINDDEVYVTGHSNGATGSFNYAVKNPNAFAAFYGMNSQPKVYNGGTFLKNLGDRSFYNVSTDQDYYFPPKANDTLQTLAEELKLNYQDNRYNGFPHWFPQFDSSKVAVKRIFEDLNTKKRNPFPSKIYWECDDVKHGKADWSAITELDTLQPKKSWHKEVNFDILEKLSYNDEDSLVVKTVLEKAFDFPRKSGAIKAKFNNNRFDIKTSRVKKLSVFISPEMVKMDKPILIYVNEKLMYRKKPKFDKEFLVENFKQDYDRKALWIQKIEIEL